MLVLSRKVDEGIRLGDDVEITVISIEGDRVRLGIRAPRSMHILRSELVRETRDVNQEAAQSGVAAPSLDNLKK